MLKREQIPEVSLLHPGLCHLSPPHTTSRQHPSHPTGNLSWLQLCKARHWGCQSRTPRAGQHLSPIPEAAPRQNLHVLLNLTHQTRGRKSDELSWVKHTSSNQAFDMDRAVLLMHLDNQRVSNWAIT